MCGWQNGSECNDEPTHEKKNSCALCMFGCKTKMEIAGLPQSVAMHAGIRHRLKVIRRSFASPADDIERGQPFSVRGAPAIPRQPRKARVTNWNGNPVWFKRPRRQAALQPKSLLQGAEERLRLMVPGDLSGRATRPARSQSHLLHP